MSLSRAAQRAADSFAADLLNRTVHLGPDRADVLSAVAAILSRRASELRAERINAEGDER